MTREMTYRNCAIGGASPIGLIIALFDRLVADLGRAAQAIHKEDIETRCQELNHAVLIVGQLESWIDKANGGQPARELSTFYSYLRAKMMEASIKKSATILESLIEMVLHVRSSWQQFDVPTTSQADAAATYVGGSSEGVYPADYERIPFSQSA